jgi:glycosyltransferase involved in cell wall biosynthesis
MSNDIQLPGFTLIVCAFNEERNLPTCLKSAVGAARQTFVIDNFSPDRTAEIAQSFGATVVQRKFDGFAAQKNWALANLPIETEWVLLLDADESLTPELAAEIERTATTPQQNAGFYVNRHFVVMGRVLRHCGYYPSWNLRLFRTGLARYEERAVHEHMLVDGPVGYLRAEMRHEDLRGMHHFLAKHNEYSTLEAREELASEAAGRELLPARLWGSPLERRRALKRLARRMPFRPLARFCWMYFLQAGFLDGIAGYRFCRLLGQYEYHIILKKREMAQADSQRRTGLNHAHRDSEPVLLP